jgi:hypothetical protein
MDGLDDGCDGDFVMTPLSPNDSDALTHHDLPHMDESILQILKNNISQLGPPPPWSKIIPFRLEFPVIACCCTVWSVDASLMHDVVIVRSVFCRGFPHKTFASAIHC